MSRPAPARLDGPVQTRVVVTSIAIGAKEYLDTGQLVDLFPDWPDETFPLYAFYPSRRQPPAKVRAFVDFALRAVR
jgi:DNA-binding transcriptional LysR family regulator